MSFMFFFNLFVNFLKDREKMNELEAEMGRVNSKISELKRFLRKFSAF